MNFSFALIAKNEEKTLPKLLDSLKEFRERGGEIVLVDTGSTDNTVEVARSRGVKVTEVGERFVRVLEGPLVDLINKKFIVEGEDPIVKEGDKLFDYSEARNFAASLCSNDMVSMPDCDEAYTTFDIDKVQKLIEEGAEQLEYNFVFSHDAEGKDLVKFLHSKFYNRTKMQWVGIIHEVLNGNANRKFVDEDVIKLEHWQNPSSNRSGYLRGLALDCYLQPDNDRNSHYFGRELMYAGRYRSAIKELFRHYKLSQWREEIGQSMIYIGDCYNYLNERKTAVEAYHQSFQICATRREPLIKLAEQYRQEEDWQRVACYARAALEIDWNGFYGNFMPHYRNIPWELLYHAYYYLGKKEKGKEAWKQALHYEPHNSKYLHDARFFMDLPKVSVVLPTMGKSKERLEGLDRAIKSIKNLNYPEDLIELFVLEDFPENRKGVPKLVKEGVEKSTGEWILYASNDIEFERDSLIEAILLAKRFDFKLVSFNTGPLLPDKGNICEHFIFSKDFLGAVDGEIFDTEFNHVGVDNLLWAKMSKYYGRAIHAEHARATHYHFSKGGEMDDVYKLGWEKVEQDRALLKEKLSKL